MKKFQEKNKFRKIMQSKPVLILLSVVIVAFTLSVINLMNRMQNTARNRKIEENRITELTERQNKLSTDIANLKTEKGLEENIREKFGLVKEGEEMIVVVEDKEQNNTIKKTQSNGFFSFLKNIFK
ncbi:MAG: septum formation initiator family protein [Patescibacteria group bacterium]